MQDKDLILQTLTNYGIDESEVEFYDHEENGLTGRLGKAEVIEDTEMFTAGETGTLEISVVGSEQYGNRHAAFEFIGEGMDSGEQVTLGSDVELIG